MHPALFETARALARARALAEAAQADVERIADALLEARSNLGNAEAAQDQAADKAADNLMYGKRAAGNGQPWSLEVERCKAVIVRLERRLGQATESHAQARSRFLEADQQHSRAAMQVLADKAEELARDLATLAPGDVTFVLILEQHLPLRLRAPQTALDALAAVLDAHLAYRVAKGIGTGVDGVGQDVVDRVVERQLPGDAAPLRRPMACDGQRNSLVSQPHVHLTNAVKFGKLGEDQAQSFLHPLVRILLDPIAPSPHIACRDTQETTHRGALSALTLPGSADERATAPARSSCPSCRARDDH